MSIFTKHLSQITKADLEELLQDRAVENRRLEFKSIPPKKEELLKKLSSFANTYGGFLIVGAKGDEDSRLVSLTGVEPNTGFKQQIVDWCFNGASPPLTVEISDAIPVGEDGKVCYVLFIAESDQSPPFLNGRQGLWVRADEHSFKASLADEREVRELLDRRKLSLQRRTEILTRSRERFKTFLDCSQVLVDVEATLGPRFSVAIVPRFPNRPLCDQMLLRKILREKKVQWRQVGFPRTRHLISQHESEIALQAGGDASILEANIWGMIRYASELYRPDTSKYFVLESLVGHLLAFAHWVSLNANAVGFSGPLHIEMTFEKLLGSQWSSDQRLGPESCLDDNIHFEIEAHAEALRENPDAIVSELIKNFFFSANWADYTSSAVLTGIVRLGHDYNR